MNMTNREESSAAEHETFPGPGPLKTDDAKRGIRPVEQMVDAAIERIARETQARAGKSRTARSSSAALPGSAAAESAESGALTLAREDAAALMALEEGSQSSSSGGQLALASEHRGKGRLRWKGLDVSDEFRSYAERVARGEDLPPFTGKILAEPDPAFPWDPSAQKRAARRALKQQIGLWTGVAAFLGVSIAVLVVQVRKQTDAWQTPQSPLATVTMTNQPSAEVSASAFGSEAAAENAPAAFNEAGLEATPPGTDTTGLPGEQPTAASARALSSDTRSPQAGPAALPAAPPRPVSPAKVAPTAPSVANAPGARTAATPAGVTASGVVASGSTASSSAEPSVRAVGTGGTPAASSVTAAADVTGTEDSTSALRADPKKEPTGDASGMGSLLVESPSF